MSDADKFMQDEFLPFCKRATTAFEQNHHVLQAAFGSIMQGKNLFGIRVTENGNVLGDYTLVIENARITGIDNGVLAPEFHTPFGILKPYYIIEKSVLEKMIKDEPAFVAHPFATKIKYLPEVTIKFLK